MVILADALCSGMMVDSITGADKEETRQMPMQQILEGLAGFHVLRDCLVVLPLIQIQRAYDAVSHFLFMICCLNPQIRSMLESNQPQLREMMQNPHILFIN
ncbi:hypothetical protein L2E82_50403 [Cichorium intybus]|nr:hypothetical protein L2E82_50403 [Cichorium intybus]